MGSGPFVSGSRALDLAGVGIDEVMPLRRPLDAVGPVQARVEPLRRVGSAHLGGQHVARFIEKSAGVGLAGEIAALPAPIGPAAGEPAEDLAGVGLVREAGAIVSGTAALQPVWHA